VYHQKIGIHAVGSGFLIISEDSNRKKGSIQGAKEGDAVTEVSTQSQNGVILSRVPSKDLRFDLRFFG